MYGVWQEYFFRSINFKSLLNIGIRLYAIPSSRVTQNYGSYLALFANTGLGAAPMRARLSGEALLSFYGGED
jgi:hypothetical protein